MVSPLIKVGRRRDRFRRSELIEGTRLQKTPKMTSIGMTIVSPSEPESRLEVISPARKNLFERTPAPSDTIDESREQQSELEHLKRSHEKKDSQLRLLHERFTHIQRGLGSIDGERSALLEKTKNLEKEKKHIQKQLEMREREILALVKRCASQEEKLRGTSKLRSQKKELASALESSQSQLRGFEIEKQDLYSLHKKLRESELAREELQAKLEKVQRDHNSIADTTKECLQNIRILTKEKQQIEDERRRERKRAEIELDKERLAHVKTSNDLREDIETQQCRIHQMEKILQENMISKSSLRRQSREQEEEVQDLVVKYEKKISDLQEETKESLRAKDDECEQQLQELKKKVEDSEATRGELEMEFSGQMEELMKKQSSLDKAEEEKKTLRDKVEATKVLETKHSALRDFVQVLDSNLVELTYENAKLVLERDTVQEEAEALRQRAKVLETQLRCLQDNRKAREADFRDLLQVEKEELKAELAEALAGARTEVTALESELLTRDKRITKLEEEAKEREFYNIQSEKASLEEAREEVSNLEAELERRGKEILALKSELFASKREKEAGNEREMKVMKDINSEVEEQKRVLEERLDAERTRLDSVQESLEKKAHQYHMLENEFELAKKSLSERDDDLKSIKSKLEEKESERLELEVKLSKFKSNIVTLENDLKEALVASTSLEGRLQDAQENISSKDDLITDAQRKIKSHLLNNAKLKVELEENETLKAKLDEANRNISALEATVESLSGTSAGLKLKENEEGISILEQKLAEANETITLIGKEKKICQDKCVSLEKEIAETTFSWSEKYRHLGEKHENLCDKLTNRDSIVASMEQEILMNEERNVTLEHRLEDANEEITLLEQKIDLRDKKIECLEKEVKDLSTNELEEAFVQSDKRRIELESKLVEAKNKIETLGSTLENRETRLLKVDQELEAAMKSASGKEGNLKLALKKCADLEKKVTSLEDLLESREDRLLQVDEELETERSEVLKKNSQIGSLQSQKESLEASISNVSEEMMSLRKLLGSQEEKFLNMDSSLERAQEAIEAKDLQISTLHADLSEEKQSRERIEVDLNQVREKLGETERKNVEYQSLLQDQTNANGAIQEELKHSNEMLQSEKLEFQSTSTNFESEIRKLKTEIALKDDEIRDLKLVELKDAEEAVASMQKDLASIQCDANEKEMAFANRIKALQIENDTWKNNFEELTRSAKLAKDQNETQVECLEQQVQNLKSKGETMEAQLSDQNSRLQERHDTIISLSEQRSKLEEEVEEIRMERDALLKSEFRAKEETEKTKAALDCSIVRAREESDFQRYAKEADHRKQVQEIQGELKSTRDTLNATEQKLKERNLSLGEMLGHNKNLEAKLEKIQASAMSLAAERNREKMKCEENQISLRKCKNELFEKEKIFTKQLNDERMLRDYAEKCLSRIKGQYDDAIRNKKSVADLERENASLKDKISRQEAYLQRKLQKEKAMRDQKSPVTPARNKAPHTPVRMRASPRKTPSSATKSNATQSVYSETSSRRKSFIPSAIPTATASVER